MPSFAHISALLGALCLAGCSDDAAPPGSADAQVQGPSARAQLQKLKGGVTVKRASGDDWFAATEGLALFENDKVKTQPASSALLVFPNGSQVKLGEDALIGISETALHPGRDRTDLTVLRGTVDAELEDAAKQSLSVATPSATVRSGREIVFQ